MPENMRKCVPKILKTIEILFLMILGRYHALNTLETLWMVRFQICTKTDDFEFCGLLIASMVKNQETNETVILMLEGVGIPGR